MGSFVYILRCADDTLYTGWTTDVAARLAAHRAGQGAKYTHSRRPLALVYYETCADKREGLRREYALKRLTRAQKLELIASVSAPDEQGGNAVLTLFWYPRCSTCQKAKRWLDERGMAYKLRDIVLEPPSVDELRRWMERDGLPLKRFFNTSGLKYKELSLKDKLPGMEAAEQLALLAQDGMLVKRPLLIGERRVFAGFKPAEWEAIQ